MNHAEQMKAAKYMECSSFTQDGLNSVFEEAVKIVLSSVVHKKNVPFGVLYGIIPLEDFLEDLKW